MKKINTLTLNAYRHAVHILKPRHERDKAHHWGTLQTTARLPLAQLARCVTATQKPCQWGQYNISQQDLFNKFCSRSLNLDHL